MKDRQVLYIKLPAELAAWVKETAAANRRSMTGEITLILERARDLLAGQKNSEGARP